MDRKWKLSISGVCAALFVVLILLLRRVDTAAIGPEKTIIGLSHINRFFFELFGVNRIWYSITDWLGILAVLTAFLFAVLGFVQMIRRRSLVKVDREILALGMLYVVSIGIYLFFERVIINFRPVILPGSTHPEASFPSSHTMLMCVIMGSAILLFQKYVRSEMAGKLLKTACLILIGITVFGRLISGVHWFTDIVGAMLISTALLALFSAVINAERVQRAESGSETH